MTSAAELGISEQEFQDATNLEKLYVLINKAGSRCSKCSNPPTRVDCSSFQFLCNSHAAGKGNCKKIGDERFATFEVERLQRKYGGSSKQNSPKTAPIRSSRVDKHQRSRSSKHKRRSPSSERIEDSSSESDDYDYTPVKSSRSRRSKNGSSRPQFSASFDEEFSAPPQQHQQSYLPGMAGILMQQQKQQPHFGGGMIPQQQQLDGMMQMPQQYHPGLHNNFIMGGMTGMNGVGGSNMSSMPRPMFISQLGTMQNSYLPSQQQGIIGHRMSMPGIIGGQPHHMSGIPGGGDVLAGMMSQQPGIMGQPGMVGPQGFNSMTLSRPTNPFASAAPTTPSYPNFNFQPQFMSGGPFRQYGSTPFPPTPQHFNSIGASGVQNNLAVKRSHSNPNMFGSMQGIPNLSANERDWWD